ncbi:hypothetical protein GCM10027413_32650 [Conyzicola nivalis]|uniref:Uncharacterized protein n=1 Tax=Conyzicola nivalis TaxID=1477021 RepID=A0A916SSD3_9MICO|nr:hypothetical protein [Conyzicola nivalis]GGB11175.1 hypothetical protein GCM10010979_26840 [Conyzicola nivalis]
MRTALRVLCSAGWRVTGTGPQDLRPEGVVVRVPHRSPDGIPRAATEFAAEASEAAAELKLTPDPTLAQSIGMARARVDAALAAGGRLADDSHAPDWWSLASPDNHGVGIASWTDTDG